MLLDDAGFWKDRVRALKVLNPVVKRLHLCGDEKPVLGKPYDRMFMVGEQIDEPWAEEAKQLFDQRWEYLHSFKYLAGYAVDPEYMENTDHDEAVSNGISEIID